MRLVVVSHKACWRDSPDGAALATTGGFPAQIHALSELFDETTVVVPVERSPPPPGTSPLSGHRLHHIALDPLPFGRQRRRRRLTWLPHNGPAIWRAVRDAEAVHAPVPGDVGTFGMLAALAQRKPLFALHCNDWNRRDTLPRRFWPWLMERTAGGRNVMFATRPDLMRPSNCSPEVNVIFATRLWAAELKARRPLKPRQPGANPRLLVAGRQELDKGTALVIASLPSLLEHYHGLQLDIAGDGSMLEQLKADVANLGLARHVTFHRQVAPDRVLDLMREADLLCLPTVSEGFGKVIVEAMACGLPVVTTAVSGLPHLVEDCGRLMAERTPAALTEAVLDCLSDAQSYAAMSSRAVDVAQRFTCERWQAEIRLALEAAWGPLRRD